MFRIRTRERVSETDRGELSSEARRTERTIALIRIAVTAVVAAVYLSSVGIERTLGEELLTPTRIYVRAVRFVLHRYTVKQVVAAIVHVTAGGLLGSVARVLPEGCAVELSSASWEQPRIFEAVRQLGGVPAAEMYGKFNMGIGMVLVVAPYYAESVVRQLRTEGEQAAIIGRVVEGPRQVTVS
jgi:phosphoribosylformylglycinamidine cyclo-ligase